MRPHDIVNEIYDAALEVREPFTSLSVDEKRVAAKLLERFEEAEAKHGALPQRELLLPMLMSKNGRFAEALAFAEQCYLQSPTWTTAVAVANAARRAGDLERAIEMFTKSAEHDPADLTCWLDVGDIRLDQGRFAESLAAYEKALAMDSEHPWAMPSAFYCRHRLGLPGNWLASLHEIANQEGCTCGLEGCLTALLGGYGSGDAIARAEEMLATLDSE